MPIVALFYNDNGLNSYDIYLLQAVYSFSVALFEVPSGYMADIIGRRTSLIIGSFLGTIGFGVLAASSSFISFSISGPLIAYVTGKSSLSTALIIFGIILSGGFIIGGTMLLRVHQIGTTTPGRRKKY